MNEEYQADDVTPMEPHPAEDNDIETLRKELIEVKDKACRNLDNWKRAQADFINYKRRCEQEREDVARFANSTLILCLLPVLDDLARALDSVPPELGKLPWVEGIRLIQRKFTFILEAQGITPIEATGKPFDPCLHEASTCVKGEEGVVVKELKKGYKIYDKLLRPAIVAVGSGDEATKASAE